MAVLDRNPKCQSDMVDLLSRSAMCHGPRSTTRAAVAEGALRDFDWLALAHDVDSVHVYVDSVIELPNNDQKCLTSA